MRKALPIFLAIAAALVGAPANGAHGAEPIAGSPFLRATANDEFGREIVFYVSADRDRRPLAVFVPGSGCSAQLRRRPDGSVRGGYHDVLLMQGAGRFHVLTVEKPGVAAGTDDQGGSAIGCPEAFLREHTLDRWVAALRAAIAAAGRLPQIDPARLLVVGHSEGGIVAARLAGLEPAVTHAAILSGSGATAIEDLRALARLRAQPAAAIDAQIARIDADPDSVTDFAWGHPYRRWSSFLRARPVEDLTASRAALYVVHGTADRNVPLESFETFAAALANAGRAATIVRRENADHALNPPGQPPPAAMAEVFRDVARWFAGEQQP
jgi:pimeloyl-ACP methyl ester carboxylesterase